jgi:GT2 family glycosyltransferase
MIPKIIHQLWIGEKPPPTKHMDTWKTMNPRFEYIRWTEKEIEKRKLKLVCKNRIREMEEINGKADIIRWEILYEYGGVFLDADSICVEPIDDTLMNCESFAGWEHEQLRPGLIATGTMGFPPKHPLVKDAIEWMKSNSVHVQTTGQRAWQTVGPGLLTRIYNSGKFKKMTIFPSYTFLPIHCTKAEYKGHGKIYAYQEWGSTKQNYEIMNNLSLPQQFTPPSTDDSVSILVSSLNTKASYLQQCLDSIKAQQGLFHMEVVWINDGSDMIHAAILKRLLDRFEKTTRFTKVVYSENDGNKGLGYTLNRGVTMCSHEIIMRMDADDIMYSDRVTKQLRYMRNNTDCVLCGAQVNMFKIIDNKMISNGVTNHSDIDVVSYLKHKSHWIMNHPTFCFRKTAILSVGNYNADIHSMCEDFELIMRVLKKYGKIYNIQEPLVYYRLHEEQLTYNGGSGGSEYWKNIRENIINNTINTG